MWENRPPPEALSLGGCFPHYFSKQGADQKFVSVSEWKLMSLKTLCEKVVFATWNTQPGLPSLPGTRVIRASLNQEGVGVHAATFWSPQEDMASVTAGKVTLQIHFSTVLPGSRYTVFGSFVLQLIILLPISSTKLWVALWRGRDTNFDCTDSINSILLWINQQYCLLIISRYQNQKSSNEAERTLMTR